MCMRLARQSALSNWMRLVFSELAHGQVWSYHKSPNDRQTVGPRAPFRDKFGATRLDPDRQDKFGATRLDPDRQDKFGATRLDKCAKLVP